MAIEMHPLRVNKIIKETSDTITILFDVPQNLADTYQYKPGQYLTLDVEIDGKKNRRCYSLCTAPNVDVDLGVSVKRVIGGLVSNYLPDNLKEGDTISVMQPMGNFTPTLNKFQKKSYVLFGAGSGITPLMSIIKSILHSEPNSSITLFFGNRSSDTIIYHKQLDEIASANADKVRVIHCLSQPEAGWDGYSGRIDNEKVNYFMNTYMQGHVGMHDYYVCGPNEFIKSTESALLELSVPEPKINIEYFTLPTAKEAQDQQIVGGANEATVEVESFDGPHEIKVIYDSTEYDMKIDDNTTILQQAIDDDIDPPYSCKVAACTTCRAKVLKGKVSMDDREMLTDEEIEEGYVLTCQAHPITKEVTVSYDE